MLRPLIFAALLALLASAAAPAAAQDATPGAGAGLAALGLPELRVQVTDAGAEVPAEAPAGLVLLTVENARSDGEADVLLVRLPAGLTEAQAEAEFAAAEEEEEAPELLFEWTFAGGLFVPPGETARLAVALEPGDWYVAAGGGGEGGAQATPPPADLLRPLTVTGEAATPGAGAEPAADASVELFEMAFAGLPDGAAPGRQVWRVANTGEQVHHVVLFRSPVPLLLEQVMALLELPEGATPPPDLGVDPALIEEAGGVHILSPGRTVWAEVDLGEPGTYVALCFMPDRETGTPHAFLGMVGVFTVGDGAGTPAA